ncbi:MAG: hypothetical protein CVV02_00635 [Firmicutes bacterium HGW-Firmicutes-7]|nr:MAG: hypothetical protein CVV02_00635 [Firmicutes bacterium HGW-Firmicutes-7]
MIIKKYSCKRFAGITDKSIEFQDGLNVILGPNEAGKSTLVEGIHSVLFKTTKLDNRAVEDKYFRSKFMPVPAGDSIDGEVILSHVDGDYTISREWGSQPYSQLRLPSAIMLKNEESIHEVLKDILMFGESTYSSILFSKQIHIKEALEKITKNREATSEVSSLLRKAIMELDGISLDDLCQKIDTEISQLLKRWDIERNYPENNKGISNPYRNGYGEVVESFYKKETIRLAMKEAEEAEKQFDQICTQMKDVEAQLIMLKDKKEALEKLENDVIQRSILEPKIMQLDKELVTLFKINQDWPQSELILKQLNLEIDKLEEDYQTLDSEKERAKQVVEKNTLVNDLAKVDKLNSLITDLKNKIIGMNNIAKEDIDILEHNYNEMLRTEAMMKAGVIIGKANQVSIEAKVVVTKDLEEPVMINSGDAFRANGYIKIEAGHLFEIELKSGDIDFKELRVRYSQYKSNLEARLQALEVTSIEQAKLNKEKLEALKSDLNSYSHQMNGLLGDSNYNALKKKLDAFGDLSQVKTLPEIELELKNINSKKIEAISSKKALESNLQQWCDDYINLEGLFNKIIEIKMVQKTDKDQLDKLAPLPKEYETSDLFRSQLAHTRRSYEASQNSLAKLKEDYYEGERNLPKSSYEELSKEYIEEEGLFAKRLQKGQKLLRIKETFEQTRQRMDDASFSPVIEAFSKYIDLLTNGQYKACDIDDAFNLKLERGQETIMPINLLSTGTYDSVALALRLSILEYILGEKKGFLILDDCLVDLDPYRKEMAIQLINSFSKKHQVIFTTCSPETAKLLGGHVIHM